MDQRIWGDLDWVIGLCGIDRWSYIGCAATEERCIGALEVLTIARLESAHLLRIRDMSNGRYRGEGDRHREEVAERFLEKYSEHMLDQCPDSPVIRDLSLMDEGLLIKRLANEFAEQASANVFLDISCLPKRYFFLFVKVLYDHPAVQNLLVGYSLPEGYVDENKMAYEPMDWAHIPGFQNVEDAPPEKPVEKVIVGVGFMPHTLPDLLDDAYKESRLYFLLPFPPGPPQIHRNWKFMQKVYSSIQRRMDKDNIERIHGHDCPGAFDRIRKLSEMRNNGTLVFAPFGPKPQSLAICLYAMKSGSAVYYTQPRYYDPLYSKGLRRVNSLPQCMTYALKLKGEGLYG